MTKSFRCASIRTLLLTSLLAGCSPSVERPEVFPVSGSLSINGKAAAGARLRFEPAAGNFDERGSRPTGVVLDDGRFSLTTYEPDDGAPAGEYLVTIVWHENPNVPGRQPDKLGGQFATKDRSKLHIEVKPGPNELDPIKLENVRLQTTKSRERHIGPPGTPQ